MTSSTETFKFAWIHHNIRHVEIILGPVFVKFGPSFPEKWLEAILDTGKQQMGQFPC